MATNDIDMKTVAQLYEIKKNQIKMTGRRGYRIDPRETQNIASLERFAGIYIPFANSQKKTLRAILSNVYLNADGKPDFVVYFADVSPGATQLGVNELGEAIIYMRKYRVSNAVIVTKKPLSPSASNKIEGLVAYNIQIFLEEEMSYDPTEHFLVPTHIPLTPEDQNKFLNNNKITIDQLPIIPSHDIIARYYGMRAGQIVRIERENMYESMILKSVTYKAIRDY